MRAGVSEPSINMRTTRRTFNCSSTRATSARSSCAMSSNSAGNPHGTETMNKRLHSVVFFATLLVCTFAASGAFAQAGKVVFAVGDVAALRGGARVPLAAGAPIETGDTIVTAAQSHAQLRFSDDALVALKPESEFRLERYSFGGQAGTQIAA